MTKDKALEAALPGEAEVVRLVEELREQAQRFPDPTTEMLTDAADALQSLQARAEKAEDRAAGWKLQWQQETKAKTEVLSWYTREKARAEKAEIENDRLIADAQAAWSKHGGTEIALGQWKARALAAEKELSNMLQGVSDEES